MAPITSATSSSSVHRALRLGSTEPAPAQATQTTGGESAFLGNTRERRMLGDAPLPRTNVTNTDALYANLADDETYALPPDTRMEGAVTGPPRTREQGAVSQSTFFPVAGDTVPKDFVKRFVLDMFKRNGVTPPDGWEQRLNGYLNTTGFDPKGDATRFQVQTWLVDGKPQKGIVISPSAEADKSLIDKVRGFSDQRIPLGSIDELSIAWAGLRSNPDKDPDFSKYPQPTQGDYAMLGQVLQGREQAVTRGKPEWGEWTLERVQATRERLAGTTQEARLKPLLDETEAAIKKAYPTLGKGDGGANLGLLSTAASGEYVAPEALDAIPQRASENIADAGAKEAVRQVYADIIELSRAFADPARFQAARERVDAALTPGSPVAAVLSKSDMNALKEARDRVVARKDGVEYVADRKPVDVKADPVSQTRPGFPNPRDCEYVGGGVVANFTIGAGKFAGVSGTLTTLDDGRTFFAPGVYVGVGVPSPVTANVQRIQIWAPRGADGKKPDPADVVKGWGMGVEANIPLGTPVGTITGSVVGNHSGYITGLGAGVIPGVSLGVSYAFDPNDIQLPPEFSPSQAKKATTQVLVDTVAFPTGGRKQILANLNALDVQNNNHAYAMFERLTTHKLDTSWSKVFPSPLDKRWEASPERAQILELVRAQGGEASVRDAKRWPALAPEMKRLALEFWEREVGAFTGK